MGDELGALVVVLYFIVQVATFIKVEKETDDVLLAMMACGLWPLFWLWFGLYTAWHMAVNLR